MPRVRRKLDPDGVYECWQAFAADGIPGVIATGTRLRGDDDIVKTQPHSFVTAGSPPHEWPSELGTTEPPPPRARPVVRRRVDGRAPPARGGGRGHQGRHGCCSTMVP